jgi:hypothetical protein
MQINFYSMGGKQLDQVAVTVSNDGVLCFDENTNFYAEAEAALTCRREEGFTHGMCEDADGNYYATWTIEGDI